MSETTQTEPAEPTKPPEAPVLHAPPVSRPKGMGPLGWARWSWRQLTSMRTALVLLCLVALGSVPSSLLPQRGIAPEQVEQYYRDHERLAPWFDRLSLFDVFAAPWFAAIYLLLFVSLTGCVLPRAWRHYRAMRAAPPAAPRNLLRLPQSVAYETDAAPADALRDATALLRRRRFRIAEGDGWAAAEKGHLGETGNLVFHLALLGLLLALGLGSAFGYRGNMLLTEGTGFSNTLAYYDAFERGRVFDDGRLQPWSMRLDDFRATFVRAGPDRGQATDFVARVRVTPAPGAPEQRHDLRVNHPVTIGDARVYLLGHGYAPTFTVRDGEGRVAYQGAVPFLPLESRNLTSEGVIKVPDALPEQLGFYGVMWPSAVAEGDEIISVYPDLLNPMISISSFKGDLGMNSGRPQSVYQLDGLTDGRLKPIKDGSKILKPGETLRLPDDAGSITYDGNREWISLAVNSDPSRVPALLAAIAAIAGIITSFAVRRRRVWVRASAGDDGRTVVHVGGLTLGTPTGEFDDITAALGAPAAAGQNRPDETEERRA